MYRYFFYIILVPVLLVVGCKHVAPETPLDPKATKPGIRRDTRIYIGTPSDATYKKQVALDSGRMTADALKVAFNRISRAVFKGRISESFVDALDRAETNHCQILIYPTILAWEDHPTEWNAVPDKVDIQIQIIDVTTAEILYTTRIQGRSHLMTEGGDHPEMLIQEPMDNFAESLLKSESIPSALQ